MLVKEKKIWLNIFIIAAITYYTLQGACIYNGKMKILLAIAVVFGIVKIITSLRVDIKSFLILTGLVLVILCIFFKNKDSRLLIAAVALMCGIGETPEELITCIFMTKLMSYIFVLCTGGYHHINGVALHGGMLLLMFMCKYAKKMEEIHYIIMIGATLILILYTKSGSSAVGLLFMLFLILIYNSKGGKRVFNLKIIKYIYPICLFFNCFFALGIINAQIPMIGHVMPSTINKLYMIIASFLDKLTTSRLTLVCYSFKWFGVSLFGGNIDYDQLHIGQEDYFNLDSGMIWLLQGWGIIITLIFMILTICLMVYFMETERYHYLIAAIVIAFWAINEDMLVSFGTNFLMIFMGQAIEHIVLKRSLYYGDTKENSLLLVREK